MSAKDLFYGPALSIKTATAPAVAGTILTSARSFVVVASGEGVLAFGGGANAPLILNIPGVLPTDIVLASNNGSSTVGNNAFPIGACIATADTVTITVVGTVVTSALNVGYMVLRAV
jgi:hypothetical protein